MGKLKVSLLLLALLFFGSSFLMADSAPAPVTAPESVTKATAPASLTTTTTKAPAPSTAPVTTAKKVEKEELKLPEVATPEEKGPQYSLSGYYRVRALRIWDLNMRTTNMHLETKEELENIGAQDVTIFYHKLRLEPKLKFNKFLTLNFQIDVFNDRPFGLQSGNVLAMDTSDKAPNMILKRAWGVILLPVGIIEFGRVPSSFGFGLSDNNGDKADDLFGDSHYGDTFDRILFATKPLGRGSDLILALVADKIIEGVKSFDNLIRPSGATTCQKVFCFGGDDLNQSSIVLLYNMGSGEHEGEEGYEGPIVVGNELTYRWQDSTDSSIFSNDFYLKVNLGLLYTNYEYVKLSGSTKALSVMTTDNQGNMKLVYPKVTVDAAGWIWDVGINTDEYRFNLELGSASGDIFGNPINPTTDHKFTQFSFHPDYNVGLLMFEYGLDTFMRDYAISLQSDLEQLVENGVISAAVAQQLIESLSLLATNGAVTNAFYVNPVYTHKLFDNNLNITVGYLYARANSPRRLANNVDVYNYGHEIDFGVKYKYEKNVIFGLEGGIFFPGDFFDSASPRVSGYIKSPSPMYGLLGKITFVFGRYAPEEEY